MTWKILSERLDKIFNFESVISRTDQQNLIDINRTLHPTNTEYTFILGAYEAVSQIGHILDYKKIPP